MVTNTLNRVVEDLDNAATGLEFLMEELDAAENDMITAEVALIYQRVLDVAGAARDLLYD